MCARAELTSGLELPTFRNVALSSTPWYRIVSREQYGLRVHLTVRDRAERVDLGLGWRGFCVC